MPTFASMMGKSVRLEQVIVTTVGSFQETLWMNNGVLSIILKAQGEQNKGVRFGWGGLGIEEGWTISKFVQVGHSGNNSYGISARTPRRTK